VCVLEQGYVVKILELGLDHGRIGAFMCVGEFFAVFQEVFILDLLLLFLILIDSNTLVHKFVRRRFVSIAVEIYVGSDYISVFDAILQCVVVVDQTLAFNLVRVLYLVRSVWDSRLRPI